MSIKEIASKIRSLISCLVYEFFVSLPAELSKVKVFYFNKKGMKISKGCSISHNVRIRGRVEMGMGCSIAQNCTISGESVGVFLGENVMIAPNVVIVAFSHGHEDLTIPMKLQPNHEAPVFIGDDTWVSSNCTISKGVRIEGGSIVAANSFVNQHVERYSIVGGVPAKLISSRIQ